MNALLIVTRNVRLTVSMWALSLDRISYVGGIEASDTGVFSYRDRVTKALCST